MREHLLWQSKRVDWCIKARVNSPVRPLLLFSFSLVRLIRPRVYWRALAPLHLWLGLIQPQISSLLSFDLGRFIQIINKIILLTIEKNRYSPSLVSFRKAAKKLLYIRCPKTQEVPWRSPFFLFFLAKRGSLYAWKWKHYCYLSWENSTFSIPSRKL